MIAIAALLCGWSGWFFFARVSKYAVTDRARLEIDRVLALVSVVEIAAAAAIGIAAGAMAIFAALAAWLAVSAALIVQYFQSCSRWTVERLAMTDDLVERMVGPRTRLAQKPAESWHEREDQSVDAYVAASERLDRSAPRTGAFIGRGWLVLGVAVIAPSFVGATLRIEHLAAVLGAVLLANRGFQKLGTGAPLVVQAIVAAGQAVPLHEAAGRADSRSRATGPPRPGIVSTERS